MADPAAKTRVGQWQRLILLLIQFPGQPRVIAKAANRIANIPLGFGQRLAVIAHFQLGKSLLVVLQFIGQGVEPLPALGAAGFAPVTVERAASCAHGMINVFFSAGRDPVKTWPVAGSMTSSKPPGPHPPIRR